MIDDLERPAEVLTSVDVVSNTAIIQHGSVATLFNCEQVDMLTQEELMEDLAKRQEKLKVGEDPKTAYMIKDVSGSRLSILVGDVAYRFKFKDFQDVPLNHLRAALQQNTSDFTYFLNIPFSVVAHGSIRGCKFVYFRTQWQQINYRADYVPNGSAQIWMPPCIVGIRLTPNGGFASACIAVIVKDSLKIEGIRVANLYLPNIYSNYQICTGSQNLVNPHSGVPTMAETAVNFWDMYTNSKWNTDLIGSTQPPDNLEEVCKKYNIVCGTRTALKQTLECMTNRIACQELEWSHPSPFKNMLNTLGISE